MDRSIFGLAILAGLAASMASPNYAIGSIAFSDGDFADWTTEVIIQLHASSSGSSAQELAGGNPGAFLEVTQDTPGFGRRIGLFHTSNAIPYVYDPSVSGSIQSLDFSIDFYWINHNSTGAGHRFSVMLKQGGEFYGTTGDTMFGNTDWANFQSSLMASDFGRLDSSTAYALDFSQEPDFSSSGSAITFGLFTANSVAAERIVGYDNYSLTVVEAVPEFGSVIIWSLLGCCGIVYLRKRNVRLPGGLVLVGES